MWDYRNRGLVLNKRARNYMLTEVACVLLIALAAAALIFPVFEALGRDRLETRFGVVLFAFRAPVMVAAGRGMRDMGIAAFPELEAFYTHQTDTFDLDVLPEAYEGHPLNDSYSFMHYYLMYAIGLAWRLFGVSFFSIHLLCVFLYSIMAVFLYGLFRLATGRILSMIVTVALAASPAYLLSCPSLRDFGKAPFMLACFFLLGLALTRPFSRRQLWAWALSYGLIAGIGYGFRLDLLICIPAAVMVLFFFTRIAEVRHIRERLTAALIVVGMFVTVGFPVIHGTRMDHGSSSAQAFAQGVSVAVEDKQDFGYASYTMHGDYSDYYDFTIVNHYARRTGDTEPMHAHFNAAHGKAGSRYMREVMRRFPADMFARGLASVSSLPATNAVADAMSATITQGHGDLLRSRAALYRPLTNHFERWGMAYLIAALLVLCYSNLRAGIATALLCVYFGAYPSLLYDFRHYFHLAFVPYWACAYLLTKATHLGLFFFTTFRKANCPKLAWRPLLKKAALSILFTGAFIGTLSVAMLPLRGAQQRQTNAFLDTLESAELEPIQTEWIQEDEHWLLRPVAPLPEFSKTANSPPFESTGEYLAVSMAHTGQPLLLYALYEDKPAVNFSEQLTPQPGLTGYTGSYRYFFPAYELVWPGGDDDPFVEDGCIRGKFKGLRVPETQRPLLRGLYRVTHAQDMSLWPHVALAEDRNAFVPYKTGPFERFLAAAGVEFLSLFGLRRETAVSGYSRLMRRHPGYQPYKERAVYLATTAQSPVHRFHFMSQLLGKYPDLAPRLRDQLGVLVSELAGRVTLHPMDPWSKTYYGHHLEQQGNVEGARDLYRSALQHWPEFMAAAESLDTLYDRDSDAAQRVALWREIQQENPEAGLPRLFLSIALVMTGETEEAESWLNTMVTNNHFHAKEAAFRFGAALIISDHADAGVNRLEQALARHPEHTSLAARLYADIGHFFLAQDAHVNAIAYFRRAIQLEPDNLVHSVALADALNAVGDIHAAIRIYSDIIKRAPESPYSASQLDEALLDDEERRVMVWRQLVEVHPKSVVPFLYLGRALNATGARDQAEAAYHAATKHAREQDNAHLLNMAEQAQYIETILEDVEYAKQMIREGDLKGGGDRLKAAVNKAPELARDAARFCANLAEQLIASEDPETAIDLLTLAATLSPGDLWHLVHLGNLFEDMGHWHSAQEAYKTILLQAPESPVTAQRLDALFQNKGTPEDAARFWSILSQTHPETATPLFYLGVAHERLGATREARNAYRRALEITDEYAQPLYRLGALNILQGHTSEGIAQLKRAAIREPTLQPIVSEGLMDIAKTLMEYERYEDAIQLYQTALDISPADLWPQVHLGKLYEMLGNADAALHCYRSVLLEHPESPVAAKHLYHLLLQMELPLGTRIATWKTIVERHPQAAVPRYYLGRSYESHGDAPRAEAAYHAVLEIDPEFMDTQHRLNKVNALELE